MNETTGEKPKDLKMRTREFALRVIRLDGALPNSTVAQVLGKQLLRSATSVGVHYREGCRSRSDAEFVSKLEGALQELEESGYWLELLAGSEIFSTERLKPLSDEVEELIAILTTCVKNAKRNRE